ncbi:unnamed protein product [Ascophyllum nodosum]
MADNGASNGRDNREDVDDHRARSRSRERRRRRSRSDSRESRSSRKHRRRSRSPERHHRRSSRRDDSRDRRSRRSRSPSASGSDYGRGRSRSRSEEKASASTKLPALSLGSSSASSTSLPVQGQLNPAQIALAAARNLGMPSALPAQAAAQALSGLGGGGGYQANPQLLAQLMKTPQNPSASQCKWFSLPMGPGAVPGMMGGMGMGMGDKTVRELFVGNTPQGTSDFVLLEFLNAAMKQVNLNTSPGNPVVTCRVNNKYAFVELRSPEECSNALNLNGIPFMGQMLKIGRPSKYQGPMTPASTWQRLTGQEAADNVVDPATKVYRELYIGNTSPDMTDMVLKDFLSNTMLKVGLATKEGSPIIHARVSGNFAFVECRSVEETTSLLNLNNIPFLGKELKINRPSKYPGPETPHMNWPDILASRFTSGNPNASLPAPATTFGGMESAQAAANAAVAALGVVSVARPTTTLRLNNMLTNEDLRDEAGLGDIEEETKEECEKFGSVKSVHIPRGSTTNEQEKPGVGYVFVAFDAVESAAKAAASLRARTFDGRKVEVTYWDEDKFNQRIFTAEGNSEVSEAPQNGSGF